MKNNYVKTLFLLLLFVGVTGVAQTVSGLVTSEDGPLPGATIIVKGTNNGTTADFDGNFTINATSGDVLVVSFVGFQTQEVTWNGQDQLSVTLTSDNELDEVVVLGYGTISKQDATGAIDAVNSSDFTTIAAESPAQVLRGKTAGVQVTSSSGEPGAGVAIRVRGNSSIRSGNEPLIVVDGVPLAGGNISSGLDETPQFGDSSAQNPLNFISQNDIESISVLKDASSTAIYGSRGANGVIIITTKKGKGLNKNTISYSGSTVFSRFAKNTSYRDVMSREEFLSSEVAGSTPVTNAGGNYDWKDVILRNALSHNHDITITNSNEKSSTRFSIGTSQQEGIVNKTGLDKYTLSFNNSSRLFNGGLKIDSKVLYSRLENQSHLLTTNAGFIGNLIGASLYWRPDTNILGGNDASSNSGYTYVGNNYLNPKQLLDSFDDNTVTSKLLASVSADIKITKELSFNYLLGIETSRGNRGSQLLPTINVEGIGVGAQDFFEANDGAYKGGFASTYNDFRLNTTIESTLNYKKSFGEVNFDAILGYSYYQYNSEGNITNAQQFNFDQTKLIDNIEGGSNNEFRSNSYKNRTELDSFFARVQASYKNFLATFTYRNDGSTKFGSGNKRGSFPSLGLGYKIITNREGIFNDLKIRGNWGITGNQEFDPNSAIAVTVYENGSLSTNNNSNPNLKWETTTSYGVGIDFGLFDYRLTGTVDYYRRSTTDFIFSRPTAATQPSPISRSFVNLDGDLVNTGIEITLDATVLEKENMTWDISGNISLVSNEVQNFAPFIQAGEIHGQGLSGAFSQVLSEGNPLYSYFLFEFREYDTDGNSLYTQADGSAGNLATATKSVLDKQALPTTNLGFSTTFRYKQFDFSTSFYGALGHYIYNNTANGYFVRSVYPGRNITREAATSGQNGSDPNTPSTKFLEKGDFLRWDNLTVGYNFANTLLEKIKASNARLYMSLNNLAVFTDYSGFDPEVDTDKTLNGVPSAGLDYLSYPRSKGFTVGLNVTF